MNSDSRCALADLALLWKVACLAFLRRNPSGGASAVSASPMVRCDALPALYSARTALDDCDTYLKWTVPSIDPKISRSSNTSNVPTYIGGLISTGDGGLMML